MTTDSVLYSYEIPPASHWSFRARRGMLLKFTDVNGGANLSALFYNPEDLLEKYNAPDTLKCQHTFKLTKGHCLYSDMGRIFCSIVEDSFGSHDTVCGVSSKESVTNQWGVSNYQQDRNDWQQNGEDAFLVEIAKYGLGKADLAANTNFFSKVVVDSVGNLKLDETSPPGTSISLRIDMDTLVILNTCPHPLNQASTYPRCPVLCELFPAPAYEDNDVCINHCPENQRGFENNRLYHLGSSFGAYSTPFASGNQYQEGSHD